jgi:transcriptional regulator with XRE-family HTH domain
MTTFGQRLKQLRKDNSLTQVELAGKISVKRNVLAKWETDIAYPNLTTLVKITNFFQN